MAEQTEVIATIVIGLVMIAIPSLFVSYIIRSIRRYFYLSKLMKICVYEVLDDRQVDQMIRTFRKWRNFLNSPTTWNYARRINEQVMMSHHVSFAKKQALYQEFYRLGVSGIQGPRSEARPMTEGKGVFIHGEGS
ncbi:hypothetical protein [Exiguobacterium indicum]|nr:hypothetical protein [Exiguobacterium enclense]SDB86987.1 hypothetical protein SAMN05216342_0183 [Exiguobacterium enclense]